MYYIPETQVTPLTKLRRERALPTQGEVLVSPGEQVEPMQIVARANLPSDFRIVPIARLLDISPSRVKRCLRVEIGEEVRRGQTIAKKGGLLGRTVKSPIDGLVTDSGGGRLLIEARPTPFKLRAYIAGTVSNVMQGHGVVVETTGALIQGIWGTGGESSGVLKSLVESPDEPLRARAINPSCHGTIIIGGSRINEEGLERAQELQVRGIVTGGMPAALLPLAEELSCPIVATEGLGETPMSKPIFELLTTNEGRTASISGKTQSGRDHVRPEIIISLPAKDIPPTQTQPGAPLETGTRVRATRAPYMGLVGTVISLPEHARHIETSKKVHCAEVDFGEEEPAIVPLANLEILR